MGSLCSPSGLRCWPARMARVSRAALANASSRCRSRANRRSGAESFGGCALMMVALGVPGPQPERSGIVVVQADVGVCIHRLQLGLAALSGCQITQVIVVDVPGEVDAGTDRAFELLDAGIALGRAGHQVLHVLIDQPVGPDEGGDLLLAAVVGNEVPDIGHVDAIDAGMAHRRGRRGKIDPPGPRLPGHFDDLPAGGATDDGVVHQQDVLVPELQLDGAELLPHGALALALSRPDEGATNIAILYQPR